MVFINAGQYKVAYHHIVSQARGSNAVGTFILVAPDPDAICAARLLHDLLKADYVPNTIIPVWSETHLRGDVSERLHKENVQSLVLINFGAMLDLLEDLSFLADTTLIHVIDSHRPVYLRNLFEPSEYARTIFERRKGQYMPEMDNPEQTVVIWADAEGDESREAEKEAYEAMLFEPPSDSDDDSDEDDFDEVEEPEDEEGSGEEGGSPSAAKRRRGQKQDNGLTKRQRHKYRARIAKYSSQGLFYGQSVANQVFALAVDMERADEDSVWLAILGLTFQFNANLIDKDRYNAYVNLLGDEVARLSSNPESLTAQNEVSGASSGPNDRSIRPSDELRFCLFRHWNLYDAMYHSGYVAGKMNLWKEQGKKNLSGMLAKMGYSIQQSTETYAHMDSDLKTRLHGNVKRLAPEYGLDDLTYDSFIRKAGYRTDISASDAVEGLSALLEVATGVRLEFGNNSVVTTDVHGGGGGVGAGREEWSEGIKSWVEKNGDSARSEDKENRPAGRNGAQEDEERLEKWMTKKQDWASRNFWLAWDALSADTKLLRDALPLSMALHRAITAQGTYILDKQTVKTVRNCRMTVIKDGPWLDIFRHPSTLLRLALWLVDSVRAAIEQSSYGAHVKRQPLPFIVACLDEEEDKYTVVGTIGAVEYGDVKKNSFDVTFAQAASEANANFSHTSFEGSVIDIRKNDLDKFLQRIALHQ